MGLVICRSTTSDLIKMANKITTFFTEQASSSVRMLSSVNYLPPLDGDAVSSLANPLSTQSVQKNAKEHSKDGTYKAKRKKNLAKNRRKRFNFILLSTSFLFLLLPGQ
jgi:hypothetical protein